jgi:hypothetical protein
VKKKSDTNRQNPIEILSQAGVEKAIELVDQDVTSGTDRFADIDPRELAELVGLSCECREGWNGFYYAETFPLEEEADNFGGVAEVIYHLKGEISESRYSEIESIAEEVDKEDRRDLSFLSKAECKLAEHQVWADRLKGNMENGICYLLQATVEAGDDELYFEADGEDDGSIGEVRGPYDQRNGKFMDMEKLITEDDVDILEDLTS